MTQYYEFVNNFLDISKFDQESLNYIYTLFKVLIYYKHVPLSLIKNVAFLIDYKNLFIKN